MKKRKIKRIARKVTIITITVIAFICELAMPLLYAFHEERTLYAVVWLLGFAWCMCFVTTNEKRCEDVY